MLHGAELEPAMARCSERGALGDLQARRHEGRHCFSSRHAAQNWNPGPAKAAPQDGAPDRPSPHCADASRSPKGRSRTRLEKF